MPLSEFVIDADEHSLLIRHAPCGSIVTRIITEMRLDTIVQITQAHTCPTEEGHGPDGTA